MINIDQQKKPIYNGHLECLFIFRYIDVIIIPNLL